MPFIRFVIRLYALTLRLYPRRFRAEFAEEMRAVFAEALTEAAERGLPRWSASWIGYALHGLMGMLGLIPGYTPALALSWLALIVGVVFWLSRRDPLTGLLAVLPLAPMLVWLIQMDEVIRLFFNDLFIFATVGVPVWLLLAWRGWRRMQGTA